MDGTLNRTHPVELLKREFMEPCHKSSSILRATEGTLKAASIVYRVLNYWELPAMVARESGGLVGDTGHR